MNDFYLNIFLSVYFAFCLGRLTSHWAKKIADYIQRQKEDRNKKDT